MERELPNNLSAERSVLGAALIDPLAWDAIDLQVDDFHHVDHQKIYKHMLEIRDTGTPVDVVTVAAKGESPMVLSQLASAIPSTKNIAYYCGLVKREALRRRMIQETHKAHIAAWEEEPEAAIATLQTVTTEIIDQAAPKQEFKTIKDVGYDVYEQVDAKYRNRGSASGVQSGYPDLDNMTNGFQKNDLIIVAARPSVGKTAFALNVAQHVGVRGRETVAIFSLEMSAVQLMTRMICAEGNIDAGRMRSGYLEGDDWEKLTMALGVLAATDIYIDDTANMNVHEIAGKCRRLKKEKGLGLILIDYLQLIQGRGKDNRQQEVSEISRTLKQLARELEVPVIALSQLSRGVEQRQDKRPMMSDLRESGSIEQDADIVAFLYRDDYYDKETEKKNIIEIIISKQRNGPVGTVELLFLKNYNKFVSCDRGHSE